MSARVAVILSGCGYADGAAVQEAVLTLYFLDRAGIDVQCFAPDKEQMHVVDHLSGDATAETRNVLRESARIARGAIKPLATTKMAEFDALVLPGGFGVAKNLSDFISQGANAEVEEDLVRVVEETLAAKKPLVALCISPAVVAAALKRHGRSATLTIGSDPGTAEAIEALGSKHKACPVREAVVDEENRIVSAPAYMVDASVAEVAAGIERSIDKLVSWL